MAAAADALPVALPLLAPAEVRAALLARRAVLIAVYDDGEGLAEPAARRLIALGYRCVHLLAGGDRLFKRPFPSQNTPPPSSRTPAHMLVGSGRSLVKTDHSPKVCRS